MFLKDHGRFPCLVPAVFLLVVLGAEPIIDVIQSFFGIRKIRIDFIFFRCLFKAKRLVLYGSAKTFFLIVFLPFFYLITHPLKTCFQNSSFAIKLFVCHIVIFCYSWSTSFLLVRSDDSGQFVYDSVPHKEVLFFDAFDQRLDLLNAVSLSVYFAKGNVGA